MEGAVLLGWADTLDAEYVALTQLHADALITLDRQLARAVKDLVPVAPSRRCTDQSKPYERSGQLVPLDWVWLADRATQACAWPTEGSAELVGLTRS